MEFDYITNKTIIRKVRPNNGYLATDYAMDLYRGCNHNCIYCYARSEYYEKTGDLCRILRDELDAVKKGIVHMGCVADPYNIVEEELQLTRHALELMYAYEFGAFYITKSSLAARDADILSDVMENAPVSANFSITCADDELSLKLEPGAPPSSARFDAIRTLTDAGIPCGVLIDPLLPYINDTEENVRELVKMAKQSGADYAYISPSVTMADVQREHYYREVDRLYPGLSDTLRERYKIFYRCYSPKGRTLNRVFIEACDREGLNCDMWKANSLIRQRVKRPDLMKLCEDESEENGALKP